MGMTVSRQDCSYDFELESITNENVDGVELLKSCSLWICIHRSDLHTPSFSDGFDIFANKHQGLQPLAQTHLADHSFEFRFWNHAWLCGEYRNGWDALFNLHYLINFEILWILERENANHFESICIWIQTKCCLSSMEMKKNGTTELRDIGMQETSTL